MNQSGPSVPTSGRFPRRRSLSEGHNLQLLGNQVKKEPNDRPTRSDNELHSTLAKRPQSTSVVVTAQGVKFKDKYNRYQSRLEHLMALATDPTSSKSNALLAQKALRYRYKSIERRHTSN
ncbi:hypothetical protein PPTG_19259 [Phytophthora nicotianae INRA-310]|uniref:Uncharacterized protein n=2 Tax=Phytophthora nicotianae TaxID=4792 RepID=W2PDX1_PHYN3|nr:hypothetical protein PPTG_19259 [Phytophthora nicotianae INRA-310]ETM98820.1 hypothetical protein PPTG_19259 [Phytophthora nicotianae INRA-310]KUF90705.1 hypothetical protein AM587_10016307 [Phytophthora nicotianae]